VGSWGADEDEEDDEEDEEDGVKALAVVPYPPPAARCRFFLSAASMSLWLRASRHTWKASRCSSLSPELIMFERVCPRLTADDDDEEEEEEEEEESLEMAED
jgi:hypothetical protein